MSKREQGNREKEKKLEWVEKRGKKEGQGGKTRWSRSCSLQPMSSFSSQALLAAWTMVPAALLPPSPPAWGLVAKGSSNMLSRNLGATSVTSAGEGVPSPACCRNTFVLTQVRQLASTSVVKNSLRSGAF